MKELNTWHKSVSPSLIINACHVLHGDFTKLFIQLQRLESEEGFQNDYIPGYYHQFDEDDFNFQPETITIMPTKRE